MKLTNSSVKKLKKNFPIFRNNSGLVYLDSAATSQKPKSVISSMSEFYEKDNANALRGVYTLSEKATKRYDDAKKTVADFINASSEEIIFTKSTTESLNLLAYTIKSLLEKGKNEIVVTEMEHHSNFVPWQQIAKREGMKFKAIKVRDDFTLDLKDAENKITDKTAVVAFTHISNVLGTVNPVEKIVKLAKKKGAMTVVDSAQSVQSVGVDVKKIGCDFLAFSGHKAFGPTGIGVLYGRKKLLEKLTPFNFGGGMIKKVSVHETEWAEVPRKFEAGTYNVSGAVGLSEALKFVKKIGIKNIREWDSKLTEYALKKLGEIEGIEMYNPGKEKGVGIVSFNVEGVHPHDVAELLNRDKIAIRAGHHCAMPLMNALGIKGTCRASFSIYNTFEDVDKLVNSLKKIKEKFE